MNYGGFAPSLALLAGSPALDAALGLDCPSVDQRGRSRPFGPACDIGAFESSPPYAVVGSVYGYMIPAGLSVSANGLSATTDSSLNYILTGLSPGSVSVLPADGDFVYMPANRNLTLGPDQIDVDFRAYRRNSLSIEPSTAAFHLIYAGTPGETIIVEASFDFWNWTKYMTNTINDDGLFSVYDNDVSSETRRFFRTTKP